MLIWSKSVPERVELIQQQEFPKRELYSMLETVSCCQHGLDGDRCKKERRPFLIFIKTASAALLCFLHEMEIPRGI